MNLYFFCFWVSYFMLEAVVWVVVKKPDDRLPVKANVQINNSQVETQGYVVHLNREAEAKIPRKPSTSLQCYVVLVVFAPVYPHA